MGKKTNRHGLIWSQVEKIQCAPDEKVRREKSERVDNHHPDLLNAFRL